MKTAVIRQKAEFLCAYAFNFLCLLLFACLFCGSFAFSWLNHELSDEFVYPQRDFWAGNLAFLLLALAGLGLLCRLFRGRLSRQNLHRLALALSALAVCVSLFWIQGSKTVPNADQLLVWQRAVAFNAGDFSDLARGGYVGVYQQQLGLISILRVCDLLAPLFHTEGWHLFKVFSALSVGVLVYSGFRVVRLITGEKPQAGLLYLLLALFCAPMYIYTSFVYGEASSTAFSMLAAWMLLENLKAVRLACLVGLYVSVFLAVSLRTNTLIVMIAFFIVMAFKFLQPGGKKHLAVGLVLLFAVASPTLLQAALYHNKIPQNSHPMPAILHITMGTNDAMPNAGWYNGYNFKRYQDSGFDPQAASQAARQDLADFFAHCKAQPAYAMDFYHRKIASQWNAPMYQCLAMNNVIKGEQMDFFKSLYEGEGNRRLTSFMNFYQLLIYGGVLAFTLTAARRRLPLESYLLLIAVFGGFLFSVLWEAKARYTFPYLLMMTPYAAIGISALLAAFGKRLRKKLPV